MDTIIFILFTVVFGLLFVVFKRKQTTIKGLVLPGPKVAPAELTSGDMVAHLEKLSELANEYGDIFKIDMYGKTMVYINSSEALRKLFTMAPYYDVTSDRPRVFLVTEFYKSVESTAFNESGTSDIHKGLRRGLIRGMHVYGDGVNVFEETVQNEIINAMKTMEDYNGKPFECMTLLSRSLANVISVLLKGSPFPNASDADLFTRYTNSVDRLMDPSTNNLLMMLPFLRYFPGYYKRICSEHDRIQQEVLEMFFYSMKRTYVPGTVRGLVDFYLSDQSRDVENGEDVLYTDGRIITSILDLISAGNSTSRATLGAMILCLLEYPEYQTRLQNEVDDVIGRDRLPRLEDRQACPLMEAFSMEVQRFHTVTPLSLVHTCTAQVEFGGFGIPENSLLFPNLWHIHHNEEVWGDPWTFRPERFLDDTGRKLVDKDSIQRKSWLPFGIGKRQCPAEIFARSRLFLYLASFLQRWTFCVVDAENPTSCDPRKGSYKIGMSSEPKPFYCKVIKRC